MHSQIQLYRQAKRLQEREREERHKGYLLISLAWARWPQDASHPRTKCANTRRRNSVPSETAAVLVFVKGTQLKVQFVSLIRSQEWAAQHNLPFAGGAAPTNVGQQNLSLPKLREANVTTSAINIKSNRSLNSMMLKHVQRKLLV